MQNNFSFPFDYIFQLDYICDIDIFRLNIGSNFRKQYIKTYVSMEIE